MSDAPLPLSLFDFDLPPALVAQHPAQPRDSSKLLVLPPGSTAAPEHRIFHELPGVLRAGDLLVVNRTKVMPARVRVKKPTGGAVELLFTEPVDVNGADGEATGRGLPLQQARAFRALGKPGKALRPGQELLAPGGEVLSVRSRDGGVCVVEVAGDLSIWQLMQRYGEPPLPPYIQRGDHTAQHDAANLGAAAATSDDSGAAIAQASATNDSSDYQSIFADELGAVAAPTASLHFTAKLLEDLTAAGIERAEVLLHVGPGTFLPVRPEHNDDVRAHQMHGEIYDIPPATWAAIEATRARGGRVVAVGTTSLRALETYALTQQSAGVSQLFCYPGFRFRVVDAMVTNFHLPRSTLLMLVSAFVGRERLLAAYKEAIERRYRFYSYGDAMFLERAR